MKNILLCLTVLVLAISCSQDSDLDSKIAGAEVTSLKNISPENLSNRMEKEGKRYYEALEQYLKQNDDPASVAQMTDYLNFISKSISQNNLTGRVVIPFTDEWVESIIDNPDSSLMTIVESSTLSYGAKSNVTSFLQALMGQRQEEFSVLHSFIVSYENNLNNDTSLVEDEKDTLLTVASISRYSLYSAAERKDRDWEKSAGSKPAASFLKPDLVADITIIGLLKKLITQ